MKNWVRRQFGCIDKDRLEDAEMIIRSFEIMLNIAHLSENKSSACEWARQEIRNYDAKWGKQNEH